MKYFDFAGVNASRVAQGCMRIGGMSAEEIDRLIRSDLDMGINFFDHADIYGGGSCETKFGDFSWHPLPKNVCIQSHWSLIHPNLLHFCTEKN